MHVLIAKRCMVYKIIIIVILRCMRKTKPIKSQPDGLYDDINIKIIFSDTLLLLPVLLFLEHQVMQQLPGWVHNARVHLQQ